MLRKIKRFFNLPIVEWVENTQKNTSNEADEYLYIFSPTEGDLMLTIGDVKAAKKLASKNNEDK